MDVKSVLTPELIAEIAEKTGQTKTDTKKVLQKALPDMIKNFEEKTASEKGVQELQDAVEADKVHAAL